MIFIFCKRDLHEDLTHFDNLCGEVAVLEKLLVVLGFTGDTLPLTPTPHNPRNPVLLFPLMKSLSLTLPSPTD